MNRLPTLLAPKVHLPPYRVSRASKCFIVKISFMSNFSLSCHRRNQPVAPSLPVSELDAPAGHRPGVCDQPLALVCRPAVLAARLSHVTPGRLATLPCFGFCFWTVITQVLCTCPSVNMDGSDPIITLGGGRAGGIPT